jgi:putative heme-binding domain-containing protein
MNYYDTKIRKKAREVLAINEDRKAILQNYLVAAEKTGDVLLGKKLFEDNCSTCHQIKGLNGTSFGPDLSTLKSRNTHSIITEIINPNNSIADKYGSWDIELKNGTKLTGIITNENNQQIFLKIIGGSINTISVADIKSKNISKYSAMPNGLENAISVAQMSDLVAFIKNI